MAHPGSSFAPVLFVDDVAAARNFYEQGLSAGTLRTFLNDTGGLHVAEMAVQGAIFHLHEEMPHGREKTPFSLRGTCVELGLFVADPDTLLDQAVAAGARVLSPIRDYAYGLRQGTLEDPFGHHWTFQRWITINA